MVMSRVQVEDNVKSGWFTWKRKWRDMEDNLLFISLSKGSKIEKLRVLMSYQSSAVTHPLGT